jgi:hypothetical protein
VLRHQGHEEAKNEISALELDYLASKHQNKMGSYRQVLYKATRALARGNLRGYARYNDMFGKLAQQHRQELQTDRQFLDRRMGDLSEATVTQQDGEVVKPRAARGGTELYLANWHAITTDPYVLECVAGYQLEFTAIPPTGGNRPEESVFRGSEEQESIVENEVRALLEKQAIVPMERRNDQFVSRLFVVPKKDGNWRAVLNLKPLNAFIQKNHFKMEDWWSLRALLQEGDYMIRVDLKDAFLSIPMHRNAVRFLCFDWRGQRYAWQRLPFGLTSSPRVFTKVLKPVVAYLRQQGIKLSIYMDDLLFWHAKAERLRTQVAYSIEFIQALGLLVNLEKSDLEPSQIMDFLGFQIDLVEFKLHLTAEKSRLILGKLEELRRKTQISGRELASILGKLSAASQSLLVAPLYFRRLQAIQGRTVKANGGRNYDQMIRVEGAIAEELDWWIENFPRLKPAPIAHPRVTLTIFTDSSLQGWGAHAGNTSIQGRWTMELQKEHINVLELLAIKNGLFAFAKHMKNTAVQVYSDNSSAVAVLRKLGSIRSAKLNQIAMDIWEWAMQRDLIILALHIAGKVNVLADQASRVFLDRNSWQLLPERFALIDLRWGPHDVDLFADAFNHQVANYVSWKPDPGSSAVDAFTQDWRKWKNIYAFPPFGLIARVLQQVRSQKVTITLVFPFWTTQPWYPIMMEMALEEPLALPDHEKLLQDIQGNKHPLLSSSTLRLGACRIGHL